MVAGHGRMMIRPQPLSTILTNENELELLEVTGHARQETAEGKVQETMTLNLSADFTDFTARLLAAT